MASTQDRRLELHEILSNICERCEFSPPADIQLDYPCILYDRVNNVVDYADNKPYNMMTRYTITVIDPDPDSEIVPQIEQLPMCSYDRHFETNNLNHDIFTIYY